MTLAELVRRIDNDQLHNIRHGWTECCYCEKDATCFGEDDTEPEGISACCGACCEHKECFSVENVQEYVVRWLSKGKVVLV